MSKEKSALPHKEHVVLGMSAAVGAFFMFTVMNMFAKMLSVNHSVIEIAFYRNLVACLPFLILIFGFGRREILIIRSKPSLVGIRAAIGTRFEVKYKEISPDFSQNNDLVISYLSWIRISIQDTREAQCLIQR